MKRIFSSIKSTSSEILSQLSRQRHQRSPRQVNPLSANIHIQILQTHILQELVERIWEKIKAFFSDDHFINSHNLISWQSMDIVKRKLMLVTINTIYKGLRVFSRLFWMKSKIVAGISWNPRWIKRLSNHFYMLPKERNPLVFHESIFILRGKDLPSFDQLYPCFYYVVFLFLLFQRLQ